MSKHNSKRKRKTRPAPDNHYYDGECCSDGLPRQERPRGGGGRSDRVDASPSRPCPICGRASRCSSPKDPSGVWLCIGGLGDDAPGWDYLGPAKRDHAWGVYRPADGAAPAAPPRRPVDPDPRNDQDSQVWEEAADSYRKSLTDSHRANLAKVLGLPVWALDSLGIGWDEKRGCWTFPEVNGDEEVIGIGTRNKDGTKKTMTGSQRGLTLPQGWRERALDQKVVYIPEGPSDVLALHAAGLPVVGRPSNCGGVRHLVVLLGKLPGDIEVRVLGENDLKEDGRFPGRDGAVSVTSALRSELPDRAVSWALPPGNSKDARAWFLGQRLGPDPEDWERAGREFVSGLVPGVDDGLEAEAERYRLVQEARRAQSDYEDWAKTLKDKKCHRKDGCGQIAKGFRRKGGGPAQIMSGLLYCGGCDCDGCRRHRQLKVGDWATYTILGDGDRLRHQVYLWQGPVARWQAVRQAMHRAGVGGYTRVHTEDGLVVIADKSFPGCTPGRPAKALALFLGAVLVMVRRRQAVTFGGSWVLAEKDAVWEQFGRVHPAVLRAVGEEMGAIVSNVWGRRGVLLEFLPGTEPWVPKEVERIALLASQLVPRGGEKALGGKCDSGVRQAVALARAEARAAMRRGGPPPWTSPEFAEGLQEALRARAGKGVAA